jgi:hypothetical protein
MPDITESVERGLTGLDALLLAVRASGGYKYRKSFKGTQQEVDEAVGQAVPKLRSIVIALILAETMLAESVPVKFSLKDIWKPRDLKRWDEYVMRRVELFKALDAKQKERAAMIKMKMANWKPRG